MSIDGKHAYRFGFLKSEKWDQIRLTTLVNQKGKCFICGNEAWNNDVHHVVYSKNWEKPTRNRQLIVLCRECHELTHKLIEGREFKTKSEKWSHLHRVRDVVKSALVDKKIASNQKPPRPIACKCCSTKGEFEFVNVLTAIELSWPIRLCGHCTLKCSNFVLQNSEAMKQKPGAPYALLKKFFQEVRRVAVLTSPSA